MSEDPLRELIEYRMRRAWEALDEASLMRREGHWNTCANRLYYARFYAVTALLAAKGLGSSRHSGVRVLFNQHFVKTELMGKDAGRLFSQLYEARQEADYADFVIYDAATIETWIPQITAFLQTAERLLPK